MDGFHKIDLDTPKMTAQHSRSKPAVMTPMRNKRKSKFFKSPRVRTAAIILVLFFIFVIFFVLLPAQRTYKSALATYRQAKLVSAAMKTQNVKVANEELKKTRTELENTQKNLHFMGYLHFIPLANFYYNDADHMVKAGLYGIDAAEITVSAIEPYADVLGLKGQGSFAMGSAEDRIKTAVMTMGKITPKIDDISNDLVQMKKEIDGVNPKHYPSLIFGKKIQTQLTQVHDLTDQGVDFVDQARPLIKVLPSLLGEQSAKKIPRTFPK